MWRFQDGYVPMQQVLEHNRKQMAGIASLAAAEAPMLGQSLKILGSVAAGIGVIGGGAYLLLRNTSQNRQPAISRPWTERVEEERLRTSKLDQKLR